jgi:hypothetical protein
VNFKEFLNLYEFGEIIDTPPENINLRTDGSALKYDFQVEGERYEVLFLPTVIYGTTYIPITSNAFEIEFFHEQSTKPTGKGKGTEVYKHLIQAVKKLIEQRNPEGLKFSGSVVEQKVMYASFYNRFLSKFYTQIDAIQYLRIDYLKSLEQRGGNTWEIIKNKMHGFDPFKHAKELKNNKEAKRRSFLILKKEAVGKIVYNSIVGVSYLNKIEPHEADLMWMDYNDTDNLRHYKTVTYQDTIRPLDSKLNDPTITPKLGKLKSALVAIGIKNAQPWTVLNVFST